MKFVTVGKKIILSSARISFWLLCLIQGVTLASPVFSPQRYNLKLLEAAPMLFEFHRLTTTDVKQEFHYPQRDSAWRLNADEREKDALLKYGSNRAFLATSLVGGIDYRGGESLGDTIWPGIDGGLYMRGYLDSLEFVLDARIYSEGHSAQRVKSYDGEYIDVQQHPAQCWRGLGLSAT